MVWAALTKVQQPDLIGQECAPQFPTWFLEQFFKDDFDSVTVKRVDPLLIGYPVSRPRTYTYFFNRNTVSFLGSPKEFE